MCWEGPCLALCGGRREGQSRGHGQPLSHSAPQGLGVGCTGTSVALLRLLQQLEEGEMAGVFSAMYVLRLHQPLTIRPRQGLPRPGWAASTPKGWEGACGREPLGTHGGPWGRA